MFPPINSLVKYENPVLISKRTEERVAKSVNDVLAALSDEGKVKQLSTDQDRKEHEDILDIIFEPRQYEEEGKRWVQRVARAPATKNDILNLQEQLDHQLEQQEAQEMGICPIRRELYGQCFDELIRQETIECPERGLLLKRVSDEMTMTVSAYQRLFESSVAFGLRKEMRSQKVRLDMQKELKMLEEQKAVIKDEVEELKEKLKVTEERVKSEMEEEVKQQAEKEENLLKHNEEIKVQLENLIASIC